MTSDGVLVLQALFQMIWQLFTSWKIPGTNTTPAAWAMFMLFAVFTLRVLRRFFNVNQDESSSVDTQVVTHADYSRGIRNFTSSHRLK